MKSLKKYVSGSSLARIISAILLFLALLNYKIGYYKFLRWVVCATAIYITFISFKKDEKINFGVWLFGLVAILFNPISPFYLDKYNWQVIDILIGILFISSIFFIREK